jgi:hypothetical protein
LAFAGCDEASVAAAAHSRPSAGNNMTFIAYFSHPSFSCDFCTEEKQCN